ncbi:MAG: hypothetical protein F9K40_01220 [Kofleriaceae bacterium]|nr:MAG: hypothetical protein F9K40_01220 [Kofleriaceae bacterium]
MSTLLDTLLAEALDVFGPLVVAIDDADMMRRLLGMIGTSIEDVDGAGFQDGLQTLLSALAQLQALRASTGTALDHVRAAFVAATDAIAALRALQAEAPANYAGLGGELVHFLMLHRLRMRAPLLYQLAHTLGILEFHFAPNGRGVVERISFARLRGLLSDPVATLREQLPPEPLATRADADATMDLAVGRLTGLFSALCLPWSYGVDPDDELIVGEALPYQSHALFIHAPEALVGSGVDAAVQVSLSSADEDDLGIVIAPIGALTTTRDLGPWILSAEVTAGVDLVAFGGGEGFQIEAGPSTVRASGTLDISERSDDNIPFAFGSAEGTRLELRGIHARGMVELDAAARRVELLAEIQQVNFTLTSEGGDGLISRALGDRALTSSAALGLVYSSEGGLRFKGGGGLEVRVPASVALGPVTLDEIVIALAVEENRLEFTSGGAFVLRLGPVRVRVDGVGIRLQIHQPLAADFGFRPPNGAGITIDARPITGGGYVHHDAAARRYWGALQLKLFEVSLSAIASLEAGLPDGGYSLGAAISGEFTRIHLGLGFTLNGVGGLLGINRRIDMEALRAVLRGDGIGDIFFAADPVARAARMLGDLTNYFPAAEGRHVFGPAAKIGWGTPTIIDATVALLLEVPAPVRLALLGTVSAALPSRTNPIIELNVDVLGDVDFARRTLAIDATLRDSQVAGFPITGDMALRMGWGDPPSFALSVGGFHSQFRVPPGFPALRPIKIPIGSGDNPRLDITGFLALTSNTAQVGAQVDLYAAAGPLNIVGNAGFEALLQFLPFAFQADLWGGVALRRGTTVLAGVHLDGTLRGPTPWHVAGEACLSLWLVDLCVGFSATFGQPRDAELPSREIWPLLEEALEDPRSWSTPLPVGTARAVVTAVPVDGEAATRVDPGAALAVRQKVVPLDRTIERFGHVRPSGTDRFELSSASLGTMVIATPEPIHDWFAPAQFEALSDPERLSRPGFEKMVAGATLAADVVTTGAELIAPVEYETFVFPSPTPAPEPYTPTVGQQIAGTDRAANASAPLRPPRAPTPLVALGEETFVIASTDDLTPRLDLIAAGPRGAVELALRKHLADNPAAAGSLQVVPRFEAAA